MAISRSMLRVICLYMFFFLINNPYPGFDPRQLKTSVNASGKTTANENKFIGFLTGKEQGYVSPRK